MANLFPRTWAEIDPGALRHNVQALRSHLPEGVRVMAVVKANAYGHGVRLVAPVLADLVDSFAVANLPEALELQSCGHRLPTLVLGPALPEEQEGIVRQDFQPAISNQEEARAYSAIAERLGKTVHVHLAIDTGMGRIGTWHEEAYAFYDAVRRMPNTRVSAVATHLPVADEDDRFTRQELATFDALLARLRSQEGADFSAHTENSAGLLSFPESSRDMVRAGLALYGSSPVPKWQSLLQPVLAWKTRVTLIRMLPGGRGISYGRTFITPRTMKIATLGVGYADGFRRHMKSMDASVLIHGSRCPLLGRVTMDQIMVDVSHLADVQVGDEVTLLGRQGEQEILAAEMAERSGTIAWDIFTGIGTRVQRNVIDAPR